MSDSLSFDSVLTGPRPGGGPEFDSDFGPGRLGWVQTGTAERVVVHLAGELDLSTAEELDRRLSALVESRPSTGIVLEMSEVRFLDAHSAGRIAMACVDAAEQGARLCVEGLRGIPAKVFRLLRLDQFVVTE